MCVDHMQSQTPHHTSKALGLLVEKKEEEKILSIQREGFSRMCDLYRVRPNCVSLKQRRHTTYNKAAQVSLPYAHIRRREREKNIFWGWEGHRKTVPPTSEFYRNGPEGRLLWFFRMDVFYIFPLGFLHLLFFSTTQIRFRAHSPETST